jgi:uncharacterized protein YbaP (TraB family)
LEEFGRNLSRLKPDLENMVEFGGTKVPYSHLSNCLSDISATKSEPGMAPKQLSNVPAWLLSFLATSLSDISATKSEPGMAPKQLNNVPAWLLSFLATSLSDISANKSESLYGS